MHLAQINIARARAPLDDPLMAPFVARLDEINAIADRSPGFVWRLQTEEGNATSVHAFDDPRILVNMSVWRSVDDLRRFMFETPHLEVLQQRAGWFEKSDRASMALWWVAQGHVPTLDEAKKRLAYLDSHEPSPFAFTLRRVFPAGVIVETERLTLRRFGACDAPLIVELLNDPLWIRFIGDRKVRTLEDAGGYLAKIFRSYEQNGYGLWLVERKADGEALGMCGLVKRDTLPGPDLGFAFLERHRGHGYAWEAAEASLRYARDALGFRRLLAIATPDNERSGRLLARLGFVRESADDWKGKADEGVEVWVARPVGA